MRASLELCIASEDWTNAAIMAGNLSDLELMVGDVSEAICHGETAVAYADRSGDDSSAG